MTSPIEQFESLLASSDFLFLVYYRGHWCPFCTQYIRTLATLIPEITAAHGTVCIVTAEPVEHLPAFRAATGYPTEGHAIVDVENVLADELRKRGWLDIAITEKKGYEKGMAQPGVLVVKKDGKVLERWAIVPGMMNLGGAKDRPDLGQIWENVNAALHERPVVHNGYKMQSFLGVLKAKFFG